MGDRPGLGDQELSLLRFIGERPPISVREILKGFGEPNNLARTTVLTMLERLRKKKFLLRSRVDGVFVYKVATQQTDVLHDIVESFVEKTLGGSLIPFVAYLTQSKKLRPEEIDALRLLVEESDNSQEGTDER